jgi:hypothetical protein
MSGPTLNTSWYCCGRFLEKERLNNGQAKKLNIKNNEAYSEFILAALQDKVFSLYGGSPSIPLTSAVVVYKGIQDKQIKGSHSVFYLGRDNEQKSYYEMDEADWKECRRDLVPEGDIRYFEQSCPRCNVNYFIGVWRKQREGEEWKNITYLWPVWLQKQEGWDSA